MIRVCTKCQGSGWRHYGLTNDAETLWEDGWNFWWKRLCRDCGGRGVLGAEDIEAENRRLTRENDVLRRVVKAMRRWQNFSVTYFDYEVTGEWRALLPEKFEEIETIDIVKGVDQ